MLMIDGDDNGNAAHQQGKKAKDWMAIRMTKIPLPALAVARQRRRIVILEGDRAPSISKLVPY